MSRSPWWFAAGGGCVAAIAGSATFGLSVAAGEIAETFRHYPEVGPLLPAMGYGRQQIEDLQETIRRAPGAGVEAVAIGTPIDLSRLLDIPLPWTRVGYEVELADGVTWPELLAPVLNSASTD